MTMYRIWFFFKSDWNPVVFGQIYNKGRSQKLVLGCSKFTWSDFGGVTDILPAATPLFTASNLARAEAEIKAGFWTVFVIRWLLQSRLKNAVLSVICIKMKGQMNTMCDGNWLCTAVRRATEMKWTELEWNKRRGSGFYFILVQFMLFCRSVRTFMLTILSDCILFVIFLFFTWRFKIRFVYPIQWHFP